MATHNCFQSAIYEEVAAQYRCKECRATMPLELALAGTGEFRPAPPESYRVPTFAEWYARHRQRQALEAAGVCIERAMLSVGIAVQRPEAHVVLAMQQAQWPRTDAERFQQAAAQQQRLTDSQQEHARQAAASVSMWLGLPY